MIDLRSDTVTKPTPAMRQFIAEAPVGDDMYGEDPSVNELEAMTAELLGKEAAVFLTSGTQCNLIALMLHCRPSDEVIMDQSGHPYRAEGGGGAAIAGVSFRLLNGTHGMFTAAQVAAAINPDDQHYARTRMVSFENAVSGRVWPFEQLTDAARVAHAHGLKTHMDGARLMNAQVASGIPARDWAAEMDTVWIDISKGLGAPVGAVLAGTLEDMTQARRYRKNLGSAMRQAGIIAAPGVFALRHHVERLAEDHANARLLAEGLAEIPGIDLDLDGVQTNMVFFDYAGTGLTAEEFGSRLYAGGVLVGVSEGRHVRMVTHLDVTRADIERTVQVVRDAVLRG